MSELYMIKYYEHSYGTYPSERIFFSKEKALLECAKLNEQDECDMSNYYHYVQPIKVN